MCCRHCTLCIQPMYTTSPNFGTNPGGTKRGVSSSEWNVPEVPLLTLDDTVVVGDTAASLSESADSLWEQLRCVGA